VTIARGRRAYLEGSSEEALRSIMEHCFSDLLREALLVVRHRSLFDYQFVSELTREILRSGWSSILNLGDCPPLPGGRRVFECNLN